MNTVEIRKLWHMDADEFNEWRRQNDLPQLFSFLSNKLPRYKEWLDYNNLSECYLLKVVPTGSLFRSVDGPQVIVEYINKYDNKKTVQVTNCSEKEIRRRLDEFDSEILNIVPFKPYFKWASENINKTNFIVSDKGNNTYTNTFVYNMWSSLEPSMSQAHLFQEFKVLKLGGIKLDQGFQYGERNLDFTNLDYLEITGEMHGSYRVDIAYSSCNKLYISGTGLHHVNFFECHMGNVSIKNSRLQDFTFTQCQFYNIHFQNVKLVFLTFDRCVIRDLYFENCNHIVDIKYIPSSRNNNMTINNHLRNIRSAFQSIGKNDQGSKYYYLEKCYERKAWWEIKKISDLEERIRGPKRKFAGIRDVFTHWWNGKFTLSHLIKELLIAVYTLHYSTIMNIYIYVKYRIKHIASLIDYLVWGYGERPLRILGVSIFTIMFYSIIYYNFDVSPLKEFYLYSFYFSLSNFTTLGFGDVPVDTMPFSLKFLSVTEAFIAMFLMGLVVSAYSNRSRY